MSFREEDYQISEEEAEDSYLETLQLLKKGKTHEPAIEVRGVDMALDTEDQTTSVIEVRKETPTERTEIRIFKQSTHGDTDGDYDAEVVADAIEEVAEEIIAIQNDLPTSEDLVTSPDGETAVLIENGHVVGPVSNEVMEEVFISPVPTEVEEAVITDETSEEEEDYAGQGFAFSMTEVAAVDTDGDGDVDNIYGSTQTLITGIVEADAAEDEPMSEREFDLYNIMEADLVQNPQEQPDTFEEEVEEVVYSNTVQVTDNLQIQNTVTMKVPETDAERMRRELMAGMPEEEDNGIDEDRLEQLSQDYMHLEEETEEEIVSQRYNNKNWK